MNRAITVRSIVASSLVLSAAAFAAAPAGAKRPLAAIDAELAQSMKQLESKYMPGDAVNPMYRNSMKGEAVPVLTRRLELWKEYAAISPVMAGKARWPLAKTLAKLAYYGDADAAAALQTQTTATSAADATAAKLAQSVAAWWEANGKADDQAKVLDDVVAIAGEQPKDDAVANALKTLIDDNPASTDLASRAWDAIATLKSPLATTLNATTNKVGKPLAFSGPLVTGKLFKSDQFKGKVVLVDFWATWCPPCREELPRMAKLYADYHSKGLEIVGVSSDQDKRELVDFLKQHPEMPWPQLFVGGNAWHPLTKKYGIDSIPRMYLIDRTGVLRTVNARANAEKVIEELLEAKAG